MFVYELMIRREDEGKETAEEEKQSFLPFYGFPWFICGNLVCVYVGEGNLFLYLDFFSRVWVFLLSQSKASSIHVLWNVI